jgi:hypothetical protein
MEKRKRKGYGKTEPVQRWILKIASAIAFLRIMNIK